jgi:Pyridoxamine 5'-phosphate oxidase
VPVWGVWLDDAVWFGTSPDSRKGRNLARDPRIVIHLESGDDTVILEGEVEISREPDAVTRVGDAYEQKYGYRPSGSGFYLLRPRVAHTWTEKDFPRTATRWVFP